MSQEQKSKPNRVKPILVVAIVASIALAGAYSVLVYNAQSSCPNSSPLRPFLIIANDTSGYNGSRYQPFQMNVNLGDCILITFTNNSPSQSHGLAINNYLNGIIAQPDKSVSAKFDADKIGQYKVYEQTISSINGFTRNSGTLTVS